MQVKPPLIVSLSGGKDSTAMLLMLLERGEYVDEIIFADTTVEFDEVYTHLDKLEKYIGRPITRIKPDKSFSYYLTEHKRQHAKIAIRADLSGLGWPNAKVRWCTAQFKRLATNSYLKQRYKTWCLCIGIAADEHKRQRPWIPKKTACRYPLVEWGITEEQALSYCYSKDFDWNGLYNFRTRLNCWCCPFQRLTELYTLYCRYPDKWQQLKEWDKLTYNSFRNDYKLSVLDGVFERMKQDE